MICRVPGCDGDARAEGTARGFCIKHYTRARKNGMCQHEGCLVPAISHVGMCDAHTPAGILR